MTNSKVGFPDSSIRIFYKRGKIYDIPDSLAKNFFDLKVAKKYEEPKVEEEILELYEIQEEEPIIEVEKEVVKLIRRTRKLDR